MITVATAAFAMFTRLVPTLAAAESPGGGAAQAPRTACELLTLAEIGGVVGIRTIEIDPSQSGVDEPGSDNCAWQVKGKPGTVVVFQVKRVPAERRIESAFSDDRVSAFGGGPEPMSVSGLGDEPLYRDFQHAKGGCLLVRRDRIIITFSGVVGKDAYVALARLVLQRL